MLAWAKREFFSASPAVGRYTFAEHADAGITVKTSPTIHAEEESAALVGARRGYELLRQYRQIAT